MRDPSTVIELFDEVHACTGQLAAPLSPEDQAIVRRSSRSERAFVPRGACS